MIRVLSFGLFLLLVSVFLHFRLVARPRLPRRAARTADAVLLVMWLLALVGLGSGEVFDPSWARAPGFVGLSWLAALFYLVLGTLVVGLVLLALRIAGRIRRRDTTHIRLVATRIGAASVVAITAATVGYGLVEAATPKVGNTDVALPRLPEQFDGLRVALVSDLHVGPARGENFVREVVENVNAQNPDVVLLDGDLTDGTVDKVGNVLTPLADLRAPLGVFAVSGNHEFYAGDGGEWMDLWSTLNIRVLRNERVTVERDGAVIDIAGINDATAPTPYEPDLATALDGRQPDRFVLLLAHQPLQALEASDFDVDLQVSGHTHGGQLWPLRYVVPLQQPSVEGLDSIGNTTLYTTRGAGAWGPPVRVGAPPEIAVLDLRRS